MSLFFASFINGSSTLNVSVFTVTVVPLTVKLPAITTSFGRPIVTLDDSEPEPVTSTSLVVPVISCT